MILPCIAVITTAMMPNVKEIELSPIFVDAYSFTFHDNNLHRSKIFSVGLDESLTVLIDDSGDIIIPCQKININEFDLLNGIKIDKFTLNISESFWQKPRYSSQDRDSTIYSPFSLEHLVSGTIDDVPWERNILFSGSLQYVQNTPQIRLSARSNPQHNFYPKIEIWTGLKSPTVISVPDNSNIGVVFIVLAISLIRLKNDIEAKSFRKTKTTR